MQQSFASYAQIECRATGWRTTSLCLPRHNIHPEHCHSPCVASALDTSGIVSTPLHHCCDTAANMALAVQHLQTQLESAHFTHRMDGSNWTHSCSRQHEAHLDLAPRTTARHHLALLPLQGTQQYAVFGRTNVPRSSSPAVLPRTNVIAVLHITEGTP